ncbi:MAG: hypothetical protein ACJAZC_001136 [Cryomorphaceae bacterium]|jgi:hypothetical protein
MFIAVAAICAISKVEEGVDPTPQPQYIRMPMPWLLPSRKGQL